MLYKKSAHELHELLVKKEISAAELTQNVLNRIDKTEGKVAAYMKVMPDEALAAAKAIDEAIAAGVKIAPLA